MIQETFLFQYANRSRKCIEMRTRLIVVLQQLLDEHRSVLPVQVHDLLFFSGQPFHTIHF